MATSDEIKKRALELSEKTDSNSISPKEVGGIMHDLASLGENALRNGGTLGIRKVYASIAEMEADKNPKDLWGNPLKKGNLVVIYDGTTTGTDNNKVYAYMNPGWQFATYLDAGYATRPELSELASEVGSLVAEQNYTYNYKTLQYPIIKGRKYNIELTKADSNNTILLYWAKSDGDNSKLISQFTLNKSQEVVADDDYIGIYGGYSGNATIRVSQETIREITDKGLKKLESSIENTNNEIKNIEVNTYKYIETFSLYGTYKTFDFPMKKGVIYSFKLTRGEKSTILLYVRKDGTEAQLANLIPGADWYSWKCTEDSVGIRFGSSDICEILARYDESLKSQIVALDENITEIGSKSKKAHQSLFGESITKTIGTEYKTIPYNFYKGYTYKFETKKDGGGYIDVFAVLADGTPTSTKISSIKIGNEAKWTPTEDYYGIYLGNSGNVLTFTISRVNTIENQISTLNKSVGLEKKTELFAYAADGEDDGKNFYGWKDGKCAIQRAIDSVNGNAKIYCKGQFVATSAEQFVLQENGYYNVVFIPHDKDNIEIIGEGEDKTSIEAYLSDDFSLYDKYQPLEVWGNNVVVRGMSIYSKNCRYCIHLDASGSGRADNHTISFLDITMRHYPNAKGSYQSSLGLGISNGMNLLTERCRFIVETEYDPSLYLHDNIGFKEEFTWTIRNCKFEQSKITSKNKAIRMMTIQTLGSGVHGNIVFDNNDIGMNTPIFICENNNDPSKKGLSEYDANIYVRISGRFDNPIGYTIASSTSSVLRITSKSNGVNSSVRFDTSSTAFDTIVRGLLRSGYEENNGVVHTNGYQYRDGSEGGLRGYAMGELAIDTNSICSLQNRLGDCYSNNKSLGISIDGVDYTIRFNQNYTSYTDAQMLQVFTDVIGSVADVELYNWGADYFPELQPSLSNKINGTETSILKGMGVKITSNGLKIATKDEDVDAIAIDDIPPLKYGRVVRKAILSIYQSNRHHVCLDRYAETDNDKYTQYFQGRFGIGDTPGVFTNKENGVLTSDYWGYLTINK